MRAEMALRSPASTLRTCGVMPAEGAMQTKAEAPVKEPLHISGVTRRYKRVTALERLDLRVLDHEVVAVVGPSGCGKSTLLELIAGLQEPDEGTVAAAEASFMPQRDLLLPWRD